MKPQTIEERRFWRNTGLYTIVGEISLVLTYPLLLALFNLNSESFLITQQYTAVSSTNAPDYPQYPQIFIGIAISMGIPMLMFIGSLYPLIEIIVLDSKKVLVSNLKVLVQVMLITGIFNIMVLTYQVLFSYSIQEIRLLIRLAFISYRILYGSLGIVITILGWEILHTRCFPRWLGLLALTGGMTGFFFNILSANMNLPVNDLSLHIFPSVVVHIILGSYLLVVALNTQLPSSSIDSSKIKVS